MKKLLALLLLFGIVGCYQEPEDVIIEPSLIDKCAASNITALQNLSIENEAVDSLKWYIPEDAFQILGNIKTKAEFTAMINEVLDGYELSRTEVMCKEINPKIILTKKAQCSQSAKNYLEMMNEGESLESAEKMFGCAEEDDSPVLQEPLVVENCLDQPEEDLFNMFSDKFKKEMDERFEQSNITLKTLRLSIIENSEVITPNDVEQLQPTYEKYAEVFNREARLICNAQGIY